MMLRGRNYILVAILLLGVSCSSEPDLLKKGFKGESEKVSVAYLRSLFVTVPVMIGKDIYVEGYVVSSDALGNFHKTLVIEDETGGITIKADKERLCDDYTYHKRVKVNCNSLTVGSYGGLAQLGLSSADNTNSVAPISEDLLRSVIIPIEGSDEMQTPTALTLTELSPRYISCYIRLPNVQFIDEEIGLPWSEYDVDTNRTLTDRSGNTLSVRTSRQARFAGFLLPEGSGDISGILSYFNGSYQLLMIRSEHAEMDDERF